MKNHMHRPSSVPVLKMGMYFRFSTMWNGSVKITSQLTFLVTYPKDTLYSHGSCSTRTFPIKSRRQVRRQRPPHRTLTGFEMDYYQHSCSFPTPRGRVLKNTGTYMRSWY